MIEYRIFRNTDPPRLLELWTACRLGRGAAADFTCDAFEYLLFSQPYFDPDGLIVAVDGDRMAGYAHASFGSNADESCLDRSTGVISMIMVRPDFRRRGIARELVRQAESYLLQNGVSEVHFGGAGRTSGFYLGLYGGSQPAGVLESENGAAEFCSALGYRPDRRIAVYHRDLEVSKDLTNRLIIQNRRRLRMQIATRASDESWWTNTRSGRLDSANFLLQDKSSSETVAVSSVYGLDLYTTKWGQRAVGIAGIEVPDRHRRKGYAQTLLVETGKRLRQEIIGLMEIQVEESNQAGIALLNSLGFVHVDTGVVYQKVE